MITSPRSVEHQHKSFIILVVGFIFTSFWSPSAIANNISKLQEQQNGLDTGISLYKQGSYLEAIASLRNLDLGGDAAAHKHFYLALSYTKLGKFDEAMQHNKAAYSLKYMPLVLHNSACIASRQERPALAFLFLVELWRNSSRQERITHLRRIEKDLDLANFRSSTLFPAVSKAFAGKKLVAKKSAPKKGLEIFRSEKFYAETVNDFQGIVIDIPRRLDMRKTQGCIPIKMYYKTSGSPLEDFNSQRVLVAIDAETKNTFRAFYGEYSEAIEAPMPREFVFSDLPPGEGITWNGTKTGGRFDLKICDHLGLPQKNAIYNMFVETDLERSNTATVEIMYPK